MEWGRVLLRVPFGGQEHAVGYPEGKENRLNRRFWIASALLLGVVGLSSLASIPPKPPTDSTILAGANVNPRVFQLLQRACQDCHSDRTHYPWYSYVAPVSFLIRSDVKEGREHLNLSRWSEYSLPRKERCLSEIANQVKDRDMPLQKYTWIHREARLSDDEVNAIFQWTQKERARLITESAAAH